MNQPNEAAIARIRKLMALTADRGATEAEAALAAEHVQRLLAEHNLSMASVEAGGASSGEGGKRTKEGVGRRQVYKWQRELMGQIAELNFCKAFTKFQVGRGSKVFDGYELIGRVDNVTTTKVMFEYLIETIERLARDDVGGDPSQFFTRYAHSFKEGCSDRIVVRLRQEQERIVEEQAQKAKEQDVRNRHPASAGSNLPAIVLRDVIQSEHDLNNDYERGLEPGTTARNRAAQEAEYERATQARQARFDAAIAAGHNENVAYYIAAGYDKARAVELAAPVKEKPETEAQRRNREARDRRADERYREQAWRQQEREAKRLDPRGYRKGSQAGENVSLNRQVGDGKGRGRIN